MKKLFIAALMMGVANTAFAQSGTNSPYSQYGLGLQSEQFSGFNRGMNGLGLGFREHNQVNYLNPASYSALDSLTFIFDMGASGQITNLEENGKKMNARNSSFDYAVAAFRAAPHLGVSFGLVPFTTMGYNFNASGTTTLGNETLKSTNTYSGDGGLHQVYLGAGWQPVKGLSVGANISYLWGDITKSVVLSFSNASVSTLSKNYSASVASYKLDLGAQYLLSLSDKNKVILGFTYSPKHKIGGNPEMVTSTINTNTSVVVSDTLSGNGLRLDLPDMYGAGFTYNHDNSLKVGADFTVQRWGKLPQPTFASDNSSSVSMQYGNYLTRKKLTLGGEYCPREYDRIFIRRVHYRAGVSYATPYYKINGANGPKEVSASLGFGIPIVNSMNNRSILNISGQWVRQWAPGMIKENTFRINIGLTFNERWFMKWKVE